MKGEARFVCIYKQGTIDKTEIFADTETGVNYIFRTAGYAGGLSVLLDSDGKPVITGTDDK